MKSKYKIEDHLGEKFGSWTVVGFSHLDKKSQQFWMCECECGTTKPVRCSHLIRGISKGCKKCRGQSMRGNKSPHWKGGEFVSLSLLTHFKHGAIQRNLEFEITIEYMEELWKKQGGLCAYTKQELTLGHGHRDFNFNASIDRIDSNIGYVKGNIQWVTKYINIMKSDMSSEEFIEMCKLVANNN